MRSYKTKPVKTEPSIDKDQHYREKSDWVFHSVLKDKRKPTTPLRFADFICNKGMNSGSTQDHNSDKSSDAYNLDKISISIAINVLKDDSKKSRARHYEQVMQQARQVTPFSLSNQNEDFQQEISFKGAGNRLELLSKLDQIQGEATRIFTTVQNLNHYSSIGFISFKLLKGKQQDLKLSYYDFYTHLEALVKRVNDFMIELTRCREIMTKIAVGISKKTTDLYINKFQQLVKELERSIRHLQDYVGLWPVQQQDRRTGKKLTLPQRCATANPQQAF